MIQYGRFRIRNPADFDIGSTFRKAANAGVTRGVSLVCAQNRKTFDIEALFAQGLSCTHSRSLLRFDSIVHDFLKLKQRFGGKITRYMHI